MFISKKKFLELQKQDKGYTDELIKRLDTETKAEKETIELHNEIADLCGMLAEMIVSDRKQKRDGEKNIR